MAPKLYDTAAYTECVWWWLLLLLLQDAQAPPQPRRDSVTVEGKAPATESGANTSTSASGELVKSLPGRATSVRDALPMIPGVVRTPEGRLVISGGPEHRSALLVNSVDVTDPATGRFGASVPIDIVETLSVYKTPFLAEFGRFTGGVVAVETKRGGDKWHYELNDPTPELRIRSSRIRGVRGFTPRFSGGGPVVRNRLWFTGAGEFALRKRPVFPLPFPRNEEKSQSVNAHTQLDYAPSGSHLMTLTLHGVPQRTNFTGLSFYTPQPAAPSYRGHEYRASLADRFAFRGGTLDSTISTGQTAGRVGAQGDEPLTLLPNSSTGNYFFRQERTSERGQWNEVLSLSRGVHQLRFGTNVIHTRLRGQARGTGIAIPGEPFLALTGGSRYRLSDNELAVFGQDGWDLRRNVRIDAGVRSDYQRITGRNRVAPRIGAAWSPFGEESTTVRAGWGWFFDRVPLNVYAFPFFPDRGGAASGIEARGLAPRSSIWNVQMDRVLHRVAQLRLNYIDTKSRDLIVFQPQTNANVLTGNGRAHTRQFEAVARLRWAAEQEWMISYVHTRAHGNLNEFTEIAGDFPIAVLREDVYATTYGNIPHRFLTWGVFPMRYGIRFYPVLDWRTGFPYSALDARQRYADVPNSRRYPAFFSLDLRASKDIPFRKHMVRLSFSLFNATDHSNFDAVRLNVADPQFGELLGRRNRRYRVDFDWLF